MECVFGLVGNGFAIVVADSSAVHSILVHKSNEDKIMLLDSHKLIAASGEPGDRYLLSRLRVSSLPLSSNPLIPFLYTKLKKRNKISHFLKVYESDHFYAINNPIILCVYHCRIFKKYIYIYFW